MPAKAGVWPEIEWVESGKPVSHPLHARVVAKVIQDEENDQDQNDEHSWGYVSI